MAKEKTTIGEDVLLISYLRHSKIVEENHYIEIREKEYTLTGVKIYYKNLYYDAHSIYNGDEQEITYLELLSFIYKSQKNQKDE